MKKLYSIFLFICVLSFSVLSLAETTAADNGTAAEIKASYGDYIADGTPLKMDSYTLQLDAEMSYSYNAYPDRFDLTIYPYTTSENGSFIIISSPVNMSVDDIVAELQADPARTVGEPYETDLLKEKCIIIDQTIDYDTVSQYIRIIYCESKQTIIQIYPDSETTIENMNTLLSFMLSWNN